MNYALIENGTVTNIIWLYPANAHEFPNAVPMGQIPAGIGDTWDGTCFCRDGERLLTPAQEAAAAGQDMLEALALLGVSPEGGEG